MERASLSSVEKLGKTEGLYVLSVGCLSENIWMAKLLAATIVRSVGLNYVHHPRPELYSERIILGSQ